MPLRGNANVQTPREVFSRLHLWHPLARERGWGEGLSRSGAWDMRGNRHNCSSLLLEEPSAFLIGLAVSLDGFPQWIAFLGINSRSSHQLCSHGPPLET